MGDAFDPEPQGAFLSFLDWIDKPGQVVRNTLKGNFSGAAKNFGDFLLDPIDAALPGDWIPELAGREDKVSGADLVGVDKQEHPFLGFAADLGVGLATDPLTYLTAGASAALKGGTALKAGIPFTKAAAEIPGTAKAIGKIAEKGKALYSKAPQPVKDAVSTAAKKTRMVFGAPKFADPQNEQLIQGAANKAGLLQDAGMADVGRLTEPLPDPALRQAAFDVANNLQGGMHGPGAFDELLANSTPPNPQLAGIPEDLGEPLSDIPRFQPSEGSVMVKGPGEARASIDPLDAGVGIEGVATNDYLPFHTKLEAERVIPSWQDEAAAKALDQAYPFEPTDPRYASGIDLANRAYIGKGKVKTYGAEPLKPTPSELPREPSGVEAIKAAQKPTEKLVPEDGIEGMLGKKKIERRSGDMSMPLTDTFDTLEGHLERYGKRIDALPLDPGSKAKLKAFWAEALPHIQEQYTRDVQNGVLFRPQGRDIIREMPADYVHRRFTGMLTDSDKEMLGNANAYKERTIPGGQGLAEHLIRNPDVKLDRDIASSMGHRVEQDARMLQSATIGKNLIERYAKQADEKIFKAQGDVASIGLTDAEQKALAARGKALAESEHRDAVTSIIDEIAKASPHTDDAEMLRAGVSGIAPRGWATTWLAKANRLFKPYAVAGAFLPKLSGDVRNALSGPWMVAANKATRPEWGRTLASVPKIVAGALRDGIQELTGARIGTSEFDQVGEAFKAAKGDPQRALDLIGDPMMREAVQHGVLDNGFVRTEELLKHPPKGTPGYWFRKVRDWPAAIFKGVEQRLRYGLYKAMRTRHGMEPAQAASAVRDSLYDYRITSKENRLARDVIPFFQFQAKSIPATAKFMAEKPAVGVALSQIMQDRGNPVYPWMQGKTNIPIPSDEEGKDHYATNLGLPFEAMNFIPTSFRDVEKNIVGSANPVLKSLFAATSGEDPYFETPYGSYDKIPVFGEAGGLGQMYNKLAGTGMIQPIDSLLRTIEDATDPRHSLGERVTESLTGVNIASVDPDRALQQLLQEALLRNPDIQQFRSFFDATGDPEAQALIDAYKKAKARVKAKRKP